MYENIHEQEDLCIRLENLKQTDLVINSSIEFKTLTNTLGIDEEAKYLFQRWPKIYS